MALLALIFVFGFSLFNIGSSVPGSGTADSAEGEFAPVGASLTVRSFQPLVVSGTGFRARERVRLTGAGLRVVRANRAGSFSAPMGRYRCGGTLLVARGSAGSRATVSVASVDNVHCLD